MPESQPPQSAREYLNETASADYVTLSVHSLRRYRVHGGGPAFIQLGAGRIAYSRADLDAWVKSRRVRNTAEGQALVAAEEAKANSPQAA